MTSCSDTKNIDPTTRHEYYSDAYIKAVDVSLIPYFFNDSVHLYSFTYPGSSSVGGQVLFYRRGMLCKTSDEVRILIGEFFNYLDHDTCCYMSCYHGLSIKDDDTSGSFYEQGEFFVFGSSLPNYRTYKNSVSCFSDTVILVNQEFEAKPLRSSHGPLSKNITEIELNIDFANRMMHIKELYRTGFVLDPYLQ